MREVRSPDGRVWSVRRRLLPCWPQWRGLRSALAATGAEPPADGTGDRGPHLSEIAVRVLALGDDVAGAVTFLTLLAVPVLVAVGLLLAGWPLALRAALAVTVIAGGIAARTLVRQVWIVAATTAGPPADLRSWRVAPADRRGVGGWSWRRSGRVADQVAVALRTGAPGPAAEGVEPLT